MKAVLDSLGAAGFLFPDGLRAPDGYTIPYDELDPGICATVRWLNDEGFTTYDSGDGRTKLAPDADPCCHVNAFPHVAISVPIEEARAELARLRVVCEARGLPWADPRARRPRARPSTCPVVPSSGWKPSTCWPGNIPN